MGERDRNVPDLLNEAHSLLGGEIMLNMFLYIEVNGKKNNNKAAYLAIMRKVL